MNYKQLTIYNYKLSYYFIRIFGFIWLILQYVDFQTFVKRSNDFYKPTVWLQKIFFLNFPTAVYFYFLLLICGISLLVSLLKPSVFINIFSFFLIAIINLPLASYHNIGHHNHLFILCFFLSIFLVPKNLKLSDFKNVQYFQLGLLMTYSVSGFWKLVSMAKDIVLREPDISWFESDAAKLNTYTNFHFIDQLPPEFIIKIYSYQSFWSIVTVFAIFIQAFSFLGAFNRKILNVVMIFTIVFHLYNTYFVLADFTIAIFVVLILFFPYHYFKTKRGNFQA